MFASVILSMVFLSAPAFRSAVRFESILATESANRERQRVIDQKLAIFRKMPLGPEQQAFGKELFKEYEALRAENAKLGAALKNLVPPAPLPRDR